MKKYLAIASAVLLSSSIISMPVFAGVDVEDYMKVMEKSYHKVLRDEDATSLKTDLTSFRNAAATAKTGQISKDKKNQAVFQEGMKELIAKIDAAIKLVDEGKVSEAKQEAAKLKDIMGEYHDKLGV